MSWQLVVGRSLSNRGFIEDVIWLAMNSCEVRVEQDVGINSRTRGTANNEDIFGRIQVWSRPRVDR